MSDGRRCGSCWPPPAALTAHEVGAPRSANVLAGVAQALLTLGVIVCAGRARELRTAVALAGLAPAVFLLANLVFSPQYMVTVLAACAIAAALLDLSRREQRWLMAGACAATIANVLVYPTGMTLWPTLTLALFLLAFSACALLLGRSLQPRRA